MSEHLHMFRSAFGDQPIRFEIDRGKYGISFYMRAHSGDSAAVMLYDSEVRDLLAKLGGVLADAESAMLVEWQL